jgi:hypothetical protein
MTAREWITLIRERGARLALMQDGSLRVEPQVLTPAEQLALEAP